MTNKKEKSFRYLDKLIHSGTKEIIIDYDICLNMGFFSREQKKYAYGIQVDVNDIVIDGCGHTIDAKGKIQIFNVSGKNVKIKNFIFKNAYYSAKWNSDNTGAAINNKGELTIINSNFKNNITKSSKGAAINNKGELTIINSNFENNKSLSGGAISNSENSYMKINTSTFSFNIGKTGAAILNNGELDIINSCLTNNKADFEGGAIINHGNLNIIDSKLFNNVANLNHSYPGHGGAIVNEGKLNIKNTYFKKNKLEFSYFKESNPSRGGAIYNSELLNIENSKFEGNTVSKGAGGAIYNLDKLNISNSSFSTNSASNCGSAIYNSNNGEIDVKNSNFDNNESKNLITNLHIFKIFDCKILNNDVNNIIYNEDYFQIYNTIINNNYANIILSNNADSVLGIFYCKFIGNFVKKFVINNAGRSCTITKTIFENNTGEIYSINIYNKTNLTLNKLKIKECEKSILNEGKLFIKNMSPNFESKIENKGIVEYSSFFSKNRKPDFSYLDEKIHNNNTREIHLNNDIYLQEYEMEFYEGGIELDVDNLIIDGNGKIIDGANKSRIFLITGNNITLKNIIFKNGYVQKSYDNQFNLDGGALKVNCYNNVTIENCKFIDNSSESGAGGAIVSLGHLNINKSKFVGNTSDKNGGAIWNEGKLYIVKSNFEGNYGINGGAIYKSRGELHIENSNFINNEAKSGGAICGDGVFDINESLFNANTAEYCGGAICGKSNSILMMINKSNFIENLMLAKDEIKIYHTTQSGTYTTVNQELTIGYDIKGNGGAICNGGQLCIKNTNFKDSCGNNGGAIWNNGELHIVKSNFENNYGFNGGAIYATLSSVLKINETKFFDNMTKNLQTFHYSSGHHLPKIRENGGAIWNEGKLYVDRSNFKSNSAKNGGAILSSEKNTKLNECIFKDNEPNNVYYNQ